MSLTGPLDAAAHGGLDVRRDVLELPRSGTRVGHLALGGLVLAVAVLCLCADETIAILPQTVRPAWPAGLAGVFGSAGFDLGTVGIVLVLAFMFGCYALAASRADQLSGRTVLAGIAALHALVLLAPPLFSTDVFSYQAYARIFAHYHANPYLAGPDAFRFDQISSFIGAKWVHTPTAYGPVFTALSAVLASVSISSGVIAYKALAAVSSVVIVALVWNMARARGLNPVKAAALVGLNPLVVVYGVGGGHNDLIMLAVTTAAVALLLQQRDRLGGASVVLAAAVKLTAGLLAPFALAGMLGPLARRRRRELLIGAGLTTLAIAVLSFALFGTGSLHLLATLRDNQSHGDWRSIPGFISTRLGLGTIGHLTGYLLGAVFLATAAWLLRRVARGELDWIDGAAFATAAMIVTASSLLPWYVAWLLPLAALGRDRRLQRMTLIITGLVMGIDMLGYIPHGASVLGL